MLLTLLALLAFAANSLLTRLALVDLTIDPASFTLIRLASGAVLLMILCRIKYQISLTTFCRQGSWAGAATLLGYAALFSFAYLKLGAAMGALLLFAAVQLTMLAVAWYQAGSLATGEWLGSLAALGGLIYLLMPELTPEVKPEVSAPLSYALMMIAAGISWAGYTLLGRRSKAPMVDTGANFLRATPWALPLILVAESVHGSWQGVLLAIASGALASGLGYAIWYAVVPRLSTSVSGGIQLSVPLLVAIFGVGLLAEPITAQLTIGGAMILGGIGLLLASQARRKKN